MYGVQQGPATYRPHHLGSMQMRAESLGIDYSAMKEKAAAMLKDNEAAVAAAQAKDDSAEPASAPRGLRSC